MNTIDPKILNPLINRCYLDYDPHWHPHFDGARINSFKYHLEQTAGLKLDFYPETKNGRYGYRVDAAEIIDGPTFTMWMLRWSK